ncbi:MAG: hypothetical protein LBU65_14360, partial [Planctomycetaceae bacterium]|nr:hypothetical protein [Planctomycetaceae bacterium]
MKKNVLNDDIVQSPSGQEGINRRSLFKILLTGLLLVLPISMIFFRPRRKTVFRSEIKCSINDYGYFCDEKLLSVV